MTMDNTQLRWRQRARIVAYLCFGLVSIAMCFVGMKLIWFILTLSGYKPNNANPKIPPPTTSYLVWTGIRLVIYIIMLPIEMLAAVKLLNATTKGRDVNNSLQKSKFWLWTALICLIIDVILILFRISLLEQAFTLVLSGALIFIVYKYIRELQQFVSEDVI